MEDKEQRKSLRPSEVNKVDRRPLFRHAGTSSHDSGDGSGERSVGGKEVGGLPIRLFERS